MAIIDIKSIKNEEELLEKAQWLVGKTLEEIESEIKKSDDVSRVKSKANVGYVIEKGFFGIKKNSDATPDIEHLGVEIKTCPLKYNKNGTLTVKEPLSLNIINYITEIKNKDKKLINSSLYKKNKRILFVFYIHSGTLRSKYVIKYVFLWEIDTKVIGELEPDYKLILDMIEKGEAHNIHQSQHRYLTLCPKHGGKYNDPTCKKSKREQPFSSILAEIRAFRIKNSYLNIIIDRYLKLEYKKPTLLEKLKKFLFSL
jgi:DNA mismatch repair protein MutH